MRTLFFTILMLLIGGVSAGSADTTPEATISGATNVDPGTQAVSRNLAAPAIYAGATIDSLLEAERDLPVPERVGRWARRFLNDGAAVYRFGLAEGGYVAEGALVDDRHHDCVSFLYRTSELARADDAAGAVRLALALRFAGADLDSVVQTDGRVDYDRPEHLDYSLDMIRTGHWGADISAALPGAVSDTAGSSRYPPGSFSYLPGGAVAAAGLREGDVAWLVLDPAHPGARDLREEYGLVIGHIGIVILEEDEPWLVHAARSDLDGWYEGGRIVKVPLAVYLERVDKFVGVVVTRFSGRPGHELRRDG